VLGTPAQVADFCRDWPDQPALRFVFDLDNTLCSPPTEAGNYSTCLPYPTVIEYLRQVRIPYFLQNITGRGHHKNVDGANYNNAKKMLGSYIFLPNGIAVEDKRCLKKSLLNIPAERNSFLTCDVSYLHFSTLTFLISATSHLTLSLIYTRSGENPRPHHCNRHCSAHAHA
jgi:hypothetical protein